MEFTAFCNRSCQAMQTSNRSRFLTTTIEGGSGYSAANFRLVAKTLRVMQWTAVFMLGCCLHLSAAVKSQSLTYEGHNVQIREVMTVVTKKTGMIFLFNNEKVNVKNLVTVSAKDMPLEQFLSMVFKNQPVDFSVKGNAIILEAKREDKIPSIFETVPPITVRGKIINEKGEPVAASVVIKGTKVGVTTDSYGAYQLNNVDDNAILIISGVTIETQEIKVNSRNEINITAITKIAAEDEVIINGGYYKTFKKYSTANISKVESKDIEKQPLSNPLNALIGRVPGLDIKPARGVAGAAPQITVRGRNSIRAEGGYPLYIVDGVILNPAPVRTLGSNNIPDGLDPLSTISPSNIESIEVLKDGSATAIYGSRGANGVIIITTKKAGNRLQDTKVDINYYTGFSKVSNFVDVLNTQQYIEMRKEAFRNDGSNPGPSDYDVNGVYDSTRYTNWQKELLGGTGRIDNIQAYVTGGNDRTTFRFGGNLYKEKTVYPGDFGFRNINVSLNVNHTSENRKFRLSFSSGLGVNRNTLNNSGSYVSQAITLSPNAPALYDENGDLNWGIQTINGNSVATFANNPLASLNNRMEAKTDNIVTNAVLEYDLLSWLSLKANVGYSDLNGNSTIKNPLTAFSPLSLAFATGSAQFNTNKRQTWLFEPQLIFNKTIKDHSLNIILGASLQEENYIYRSIAGSQYLSDALLESIQGAGSVSYSADDDNQYRYTAGFTRIAYNFKRKYLIDLVARRDGSSRFGPGKQFGNFGAIGLGWIFTNEKFFNTSSILSFGKLRGSIAKTGNDQIGDYQFIDAYRITEYQYLGRVSLVPQALFNPNFAWEVTNKFEAAMELGFLQNKLNLEIAWYKNRSSNQLVNYQLPVTAGFPNVFKNFDATVENWGWEFFLTSKNIANGNFSWNTSLNVTLPKNKLAKFDNIEESSYAETYKVGQSLSVQQLYISTGVDPVTGAYTFEDLNGDESISSDDKMLMLPTDRKYYGGITNDLAFKGFQLSFLFQFAEQMMSRVLPGMPGLRGNQPVYVLDRWRKPGDVSTVQRFNRNFAISSNFNNYQVSDKAQENVSFVRLKTVGLSYDLMSIKGMAGGSALNGLKLYVQGQNLFTFTNYEGLDPETGSSVLPSLRTITVGVQLNF